MLTLQSRYVSIFVSTYVLMFAKKLGFWKILNFFGETARARTGAISNWLVIGAQRASSHTLQLLVKLLV